MNSALTQTISTSRLYAFGAAIACVLGCQFATANIYSFRDENGVTHFSNLPHLDRRYKLVYRIPVSGQYRPNAWSANGPSAVDISRLVPIINNVANFISISKIVSAAWSDAPMT